MKNRRELFILEETGKEEQRKRTTGMKMIVSTMLMLGFLLSFYAFYYTIPNFWILFVAEVLVVNALILCQNHRKGTMISIGVVVGLIVVLLLVNLTGFSRGLIYFLNQFITVWNSRFGTFMTLFALAGITDTQRLLFWLVWVLVGALIVSRLIRGGHRLILTVLAIGFLVLSIVMRTGLTEWGTMLLMFGWFTFWTMNAVQSQHIIKIVETFAFLAICCSVVVLGTNHYKEVQGVTDLKESIIEGVEKARYGEDTLPKGDLTKASEMVGDNSETLRLSFAEAQEMYLRGFVGSDYEGNAWAEAGGDIYVQEDTSGMLDWLKSEGFETIYQYAAYQKAVNPQNAPKNNLTVENVGAYRRYVYAPYEIDSTEIPTGAEKKDWQIQSTGVLGAREYSYQLMETNMPSELIVAQPIESRTEAQQKYISAENVYRTFVYDHYLEVSDEEKKLIDELIYANQDWDNANVYQLTTQIRIALQGLVTYSDAPYEYKGNTDFINWFLTQEKQGNSAYYATVATLAYRVMGIPARYVEGYYLSGSEATSLNRINATETQLTQKDAHAWTEVYMYEIGWMPVEVVPGFYIADYTTQEILDIPQSSVTIQNQEDQDELQGSTTDQLPKRSDEKEKEETVIQKTVRVLGIVLLILMILMLLYLLMQLQAKIRYTHFQKKLDRVDSATVSGMLYDRVCHIFNIDQRPGDAWFPYENVEDIVEDYEDISEEDYTRFVSLIEQEKFGGTELSAGERHTMKAFVQRLAESSYKNADVWKRFRMKYLYCMHE